MAGVRETLIGVGPALRKAREKRHLSLDEASRDTKLTVTHLRALEEEDFEALLGDPYVRGSLRTYAQYLGLDPEKVAAAYARSVQEPNAPLPPGKLGRIEQAIAATRIRDNQRLLVVIAMIVIATAGVFGLVSRRSATPRPAQLGVSLPSPLPVDSTVDAVLVAVRAATVTVTIDDALPQTFHLTRGETRSFEAGSTLIVWVAHAGTVQLSVGGEDLGTPGKAGSPWQRTFEVSSAGGGGAPSPSV